MEKQEKLKIQVIPHTGHPLFEQRESGVVHTSYAEETAFFSLVEHGNVNAIQQALKKYTSSFVVIGHLSDDTIRQMRYWAVCCVTLGTRYAIRGGLDESTAFNLSDRHIMQIDRLTSGKEIVSYLEKSVIELARLVQQDNFNRYPVQIQSCLHYIQQHLHESIQTKTLAKQANFSIDYFRKYFKSHVGMTPTQYIMEQKLLAACKLIKSGMNTQSIPYYLGYCSQTYFITCFKRRFGLTPHRYAIQHIK